VKKPEQTLAEAVGSIAGGFVGMSQTIAQAVKAAAKVGRTFEQMAINMNLGLPRKSEDQLMRERVAALRKRSLRLKARNAVEGFREFIRRR
jgi:hypothetical protein